jgi:hypothetical protein
LSVTQGLKTLCSFFGLGLSSTSISAERWLPRSLGSFYLKDATFIQAIEIHPEAENYADRFTLYFTTFNPSGYISVSVIFFC